MPPKKSTFAGATAGVKGRTDRFRTATAGIEGRASRPQEKYQGMGRVAPDYDEQRNYDMQESQREFNRQSRPMGRRRRR